MSNVIQDEMRVALEPVSEGDGMLYWRYVDLLLDFGLLSTDHAVVSHYVLYRTQLPPSRTIISWREVSKALDEMETV